MPLRLGLTADEAGERRRTMGATATGRVGALLRPESARAPGAKNDDGELVRRNCDAVPARCVGAKGTALQGRGAVSARVVRGRPVRSPGPMSRMFLRLRGGASHNKGRLEVYHDAEWGTVCDDFFRRVDAKVACKDLGYTGAEAVLTNVAVAPGRRFWLDDVNCVGDEAKLTKCFYNSNVRNSSSRTSPQWGIANCIPSEQVGVRCTASTEVNSVEFDRDGLTVQEQGPDSTYTVRLGNQPTGNVTVTISGQSGTVTVDSTPLTFTTGNWSTPQTVTLTAIDDMNRTDDSLTLTHAASGGGYGSVTASLSVTVEDDDGPVQAHIDSGGIVSLTEGGRRTYRIWLDSAPSEQVTVAVTAPSQVSVTPTSLTFTTGD